MLGWRYLVNNTHIPHATEYLAYFLFFSFLVFLLLSSFFKCKNLFPAWVHAYSCKLRSSLSSEATAPVIHRTTRVQFLNKYLDFPLPWLTSPALLFQSFSPSLKEPHSPWISSCSEKSKAALLPALSLNRTGTVLQKTTVRETGMNGKEAAMTYLS